MRIKERIIFIVCYLIVLTVFYLIFLYSLNEEAILQELRETTILDSLDLRRYNGN